MYSTYCDYEVDPSAFRPWHRRHTFLLHAIFYIIGGGGGGGGEGGILPHLKMTLPPEMGHD